MENSSEDKVQTLKFFMFILGALFFCFCWFVFMLWSWRCIKCGYENYTDKTKSVQSHSGLSPFIELFLSGCDLYDQHNYLGALNCFEQCEFIATTKNEINLANINIGKCYFMMTDYEEAIKWFTIAIDCNLPINDLAYDFRSKCYENLGRYKEALDDLNSYDLIRNDKSETTNELMKERKLKLINTLSNDRTVKIMKSKYFPPSYFNCSEFFDTFIGIIPKEEVNTNSVAYFIKHQQFDKLYNYFMADELKEDFTSTYSSEKYFTYNLIKSSIFYLSDQIDQCLEILKEPQNELEIIFKEFIRPSLTSNEEIAAFESIDNLTVKFWLAKLYRKVSNDSEYLQIMKRLRNEGQRFVYCELLDFYRVKGDTSNFKKTELEALGFFKGDSKVVLHLFTYYYYLSDINHLNELLESLSQDDAISCIMKGLVCGKRKEMYAQKNYYLKAIELDPTFYKAHTYLAELYKDDDEEQFYRHLKHLKLVASNKDEILNCEKMEIEYEVEKRIKNEEKVVKIDILPK